VRLCSAWAAQKPLRSLHACSRNRVTQTDIRTPADLNSVTSDCGQVLIDLSSARSMRLLCILPNGPRLLTRSRSRGRGCSRNLDLS
jgi:hypothetical protein